VTGSAALLLLALIFIAGYVGSLWINPWVKCSKCNGRQRKKGLIFAYAYHRCSKCKGTGRQLRLGRRFIFGPPQ
jgi:DnaJ-class molecular chaperone